MKVSHSARSRPEYVFSSFRRTLDGNAAARKWANVVAEVTRKVAIYNALLEASGEAQRAEYRQ